jgi:opacity protein-like surface antigen
MTMKPLLFAVGLALTITAAGAVPVSAQDSQDSQPAAAGPPRLELRTSYGTEMPDGRGGFWANNFQTFGAQRGELQGDAFNFDGIYHFNPHNALLVSLSVYDHTFDEPVRNQVDDAGNPIDHFLRLSTTAVGVGYLYYPWGTEHRVVPYVGGGLDVTVGSLRAGDQSASVEDNGDGSDPSDPGDPSDPPTGCAPATDAVGTNGSSSLAGLGYFLDAGLEFRVTPTVSFFADWRRDEVRANLGGDFRGQGSLDLSDQQVTAGLSLRF